MEQEAHAERQDVGRDWSDIDSDEQEFLDLQLAHEGFIDFEFHPQCNSQMS